MMWAEEQTVATAVPVVPVTADPRLPARSKIYVRNLHVDTSLDDLMRVLEHLSPVVPANPFVSRAHRGRRWAKFDVEASEAQGIIDNINTFSGIFLGLTQAEYARN